jgi:hypothetical protein
MLKCPDSTPDEQRLARRRHSRRAIAVLAALAISAGAVACGSSDSSDGSDSTDQALSKDEYLKQVNAAQTAFATDAAKLNLANPSSTKDFGDSLGKLDGLVVRLQTRLDDIPEPEAVSAEQDKLVQELEAYNTVIRAQKDDLTSGDPEKARAAAQKVGKASTTFSKEFDATIRQINENLGLKTTTDASGN